MDNSNELLTPVENKTIIKLIQEGKLEELKKYKDFAAVKIKASTAKRLVDTLIYQFDEDDENTQERLYNQLDKIMDGVAKKRYVRDKRTLRFSSVNQINDYLLNEFSRIDEYNQDFYFKKIASIINQKIGDDTFYKNCLETIKYFFTHYYKSGRLPQEVTSSFYNQILNKQEDAYINKTKNTMIKRLRRILPFTLKKEHGRITGAKLRKIDEILESKDYQKLGITEERLRELIASYDEEINKVKKIRRENFYLTKEKLHEINEQFISGKLNEATLSQILPDVNQEVRTIILKKYTLIKAKFLDKITITKDELPPIALGYHYNNYKIGTMEDMYKNIINIVSTISEEEAEDIIFNKEIPKAILELLPLVDHVIGFNTEEMIEILRSYPMVLEHMRKEKIIKEFNPDVVIGCGGYVTAPVISTAHSLGIKTLIHEQNSVVGLANKFLSRYATKVGVSFESTIKDFPKGKAILTGNPCSEKAISLPSAKKEEYKLSKNKKLVLIVMGSLGSRTINDMIYKNLSLFKDKDYEVLFVTGNSYYEKLDKKKEYKNVKIVPFIYELPRVMKMSDLIVSRAGASTMSEIMVLDIPTIFIPSPYVTNNHQYKNAMDLYEKNAGILIEEKDLTMDSLISNIDKCFNDEKYYKDIKKNLKTLGIKDSGERIYKILKNMTRDDK